MDLSALSGADEEHDSRCFVTLDFDRDGDADFALVNANTPSLSFYETEVPTPGNFIAIRLEGAGAPLSNRDAVGAVVTVKTPSGLTLTRVLNAGEGFGAQNSKTILVGLGEDVKASAVTVRWPSGGKFRCPEEVGKGRVVEFVEQEKGASYLIRNY